jgi:adenine-specific DNA-methyltransferase
MMKPGYSAPLSVQFLKANDKLVLDTRFFDGEFIIRLVGSIDNFDSQCDGLLWNSENFQALNLFKYKYNNSISCVYIDPPYNTGGGDFIYKDGYTESSWISFIADRISIAHDLFDNYSSIWINIDDNEAHYLKVLLDSIFGKECFIASNVWQKRYSRENREAIGDVHDYIFTYSINPDIFKTHRNRIPFTEEQSKIYTNPNGDPKGRWRGIPMTAQGYRPNQMYEIVTPNGIVHTPPTGRCWSTVESEYIKLFESGRIYFGKDNKSQPQIIRYLSEVEGMVPWTWWPHDEVGHTDESKKELYSILNKDTGFETPKPSRLLKRIIHIGSKIDSIVLDYFAGSGTTAHAVINSNREDNGCRKYILVEMGEYFDLVLKQRVEKIIYSESWNNGKPTARQTGISHCCKYLRLESYEDTLNNLILKRTPAQLSLLADTPSLKEEYMLSYMMDLEAEGSASLLNVGAFSDPWNYTLKISTGSAGETKARPVDLVETFNYLLGLTVIRRNVIRGIEVVEGTNPEGEKVLVIWRNTTKVSNVQLDEFFRKQEFNPRDTEFDLIYINGDNNLENLKRPDETWKVRLTEEEFKRLMFDVEDV